MGKLRKTGKQVAETVLSVINSRLSGKCRENYMAARMEEYQRQLQEINAQTQERETVEEQAKRQDHHQVESPHDRRVEPERPAMRRYRPRPPRKGPER